MLVHTLFALEYFIHSLSPINVDSQDVAQIMRVHSFRFSAPYGNCLECLSKLNIYHSLRLSLSLSTLHTHRSLRCGALFACFVSFPRPSSVCQFSIEAAGRDTHTHTHSTFAL